VSAAAFAAPVAVTGVGIVTPLGRTLESFDDALFGGVSAIGPRTLSLDGMDTIELAVAACDFDASGVRSTSRLPLDRGCAMALAAARDAAHQAVLEGSVIDSERLGVFWGSGIGGCGSFDEAGASL
jgi:3-oxoacyl-[acyl-carrier-protein] synthase II